MGMSGDDSDRRFMIVAETRRRWSEIEKRAIVEEPSWSCTNVSAVARRHARRKFSDFAELQQDARMAGRPDMETKASPVAIATVRRIDARLAIEREINGKPPDERFGVRAERSRPLVDDLETWLRSERRKLSSKHRLAKASDYMLKRWPAFTRFLDDGRICLSTDGADKPFLN